MMAFVCRWWVVSLVAMCHAGVGVGVGVSVLYLVWMSLCKTHDAFVRPHSKPIRSSKPFLLHCGFML